MRKVLLIGALLLPCAAAAQQVTPVPTSHGLFDTQTTANNARQGNPIFVRTIGFNSTPAAFVNSATANTFTVAIAANPARIGCSIQNKGTGTWSVYVGGGTATQAASVSLPAGATFNCTDQGGTELGQISIASTVASDPGVILTR